MQLSPAETLVLKTATPDGFITSERHGFAPIIRKLEQKGIVKHRHGLVYRLTPEGKVELETRR